MYLLTDDQTIDDLRIFSKKDISGIFDIYNQTHTRGAEKVLQELFRKPLADPDIINQRSAVIRHFANHRVAFPFDGGSFDMAEKYMSSQNSDNARSRDGNMSEKEIANGVESVIRILQELNQLVNSDAIQQSVEFSEQRAEILTLLNDSIFEPVLNQKGKLSYSAITAFDLLFRFKERSRIEKIFDHLYYLDVYVSIAEVAVKRNFVFPVAHNDAERGLLLEGVYHPALKNPVANDLSLGRSRNMVFLTGANMAGKSTFLRSLSTALYIAHIGFPVAASKMEFRVMDGIFTTINLPDNLGIGASHFYAEVLRVKQVANALISGKRLYVVFDELFRGTNVKDAHEGTVAVASAFAAQKDSLFVISSHIVEAGEELEKTPGIVFYYLPTQMRGHEPVYTYKLQEGITEDRHGMVIINNEGILETLKNGKKRASSGVNAPQLATDRQTVEELNLLGKFRHGSVYHLFGRVKTKGGDQLLDKMFRNPLTDVKAINNRSRTFLEFQKADLEFPFDVQQIDLMREFLDSGTGGNAVMALLNTVVKKLLASLTRDERYKQTVRGLQATIITLNKCNDYLPLLSKIPGAFAERVEAIRNLLAEPQLEKIRKTDIYNDISVQTVANYEYLIKSRYLEKMEDLLQFVCEIDVYIHVSRVAYERGFNYAHAMPAEANSFIARNLKHPCLQNAVGNDIELGEAKNVFFLTGANMAGKSTLMKSIGINLYLAHMGFPVAADSLKFSVRDGLYSSINVADNIGMGYSHFYAEVVRVKQASDAASSGKRLFIMFDELFKGTNVKDAFDGTLSVTKGFADYSDCLFIVSTHIIEVGEELKDRPNVQFGFMPTIMEGHRPRYTYKLQKGVTEDRQGMMIIRNEGFLQQLEAIK